MAWIESHQHLDKNGKVLELAIRLKINKYQAIGHLHALWWWAIDNAEDGNIARFSNEAVTQVCGWSEYVKDEEVMSRVNELTNSDLADQFIPALTECGFLDQDSEGLWIHNWHVYTARYFKSVKDKRRQKMLTRIRVKRFRNRNAPVTPKKRDITGLTVPNQTLPIYKDTPPKGTAKTTALSRYDFEVVWSRYPRKLGRQESERHFKASVKTPQDYADIQKALDNYIAEIRRDRTESSFIKHGSTWFNTWRDWVSYGGIELPKPPPPKPRPPEPPAPELTETDLREMHDQKVIALGACREAECPFCEKTVEDKTVSTP